MQATRFSFIILTGLILFNLSVEAQTRYNFDHIGLKENLSHLEVKSLMQDHWGFIWIGTVFGLNRYDGISCQNFFHSEEDTNSLVNNFIFNTAEDKEGNIWVGTENGISCYNPFKQSFTNYSVLKKGKYYFPYFDCRVFFDHSQTLWVTHSKGVAWRAKDSEIFNNIPLELQRPGQLQNIFIADIFQDSKNRIWVATSYGTRQIDPVTKKVFVYINGNDPQKFNRQNSSQKIIEDANGRIWIGSWGGGLLLFNEQKNIFDSIPIGSNYIYENNIIHDQLSLIEKGKQNILMATENGLQKITVDDIQGNIIGKNHEIIQTDSTNGLASLLINDLMKDREGHIWIATSNGVNKLDINKQIFFSVKLPIHIKDMIVDGITNDRSEGKIWLHSNEFLFLLDSNQKVMRSVNMKSFRIFCIFKGRNNYWFGTGSGLIQMDKTMKTTRYFHFPSIVYKEARIRSVIEDKTGKIWMGTIREGVLRFDPETGNHQRYLYDSIPGYDLKNTYVEKIVEDKSGNIWFATGKGLFKFQSNENKFYRQSLPDYTVSKDSLQYIRTIYKTVDNKIWIGTDDGLYAYEGNQFKKIRFAIKQTSSRVNQLTEDLNGNLWITTTNGLVVYNRNKERYDHYFTTDGLPINNFDGATVSDLSGKIYFGCPGGYFYCNSNKLFRSNFSNSPIISSVQQNENIPIAFPQNQKIKIRYNDQLTIAFEALNYTNTHLNQFAYKLTGLNNGWIMIGNSRTIRFAKLPPGSFKLLIRSANSEGVWNEQPATLSITVAPPFWRTWWFISLGILATAGLIYYVYRYRFNQILKMERMRTRIATDLHDDIGSTLSSISFYSEAVKQKAKDRLPEVTPILEKMGETSRTMVSSMSDIVWAINPMNDDLDRMFQRMRSHAAELCSLKNILLRVEISGEKKPIKLDLEKRKNIYLIFKEALNNSLKYSGCHLLTITLQKQSHEIMMEFTDDGSGFDVKKEFEGNGLKNIKQRAHEINGVLNISSYTEKGTTIRLTIKI